MNRVIIPSEDLMALRQLGCDKLEAELDRADVLRAAEVPDDVVTMHSRVRYLDETTGERRSVTLVYPDETDVERGRISVLAPVGSRRCAPTTAGGGSLASRRLTRDRSRSFRSVTAALDRGAPRRPPGSAARTRRRPPRH